MYADKGLHPHLHSLQGKENAVLLHQRVYKDSKKWKKPGPKAWVASKVPTVDAAGPAHALLGLIAICVTVRGTRLLLPFGDLKAEFFCGWSASDNPRFLFR